MIRKLALALALCLLAAPAWAQNTQCANRPAGDSTNACANTRFVTTAVVGNAITALTGDGTATGPGSVALTLATVNANTGVWGAVNQVPILTLDGKGRVTAASNATIREVLTTTRTYFVRSDGSDSNTGLVNSAGGAFATWAKAVTVITNNIDCAGNTITITNGNAATYTTTNVVNMTKGWVGGCALVFDLGGGGINATGNAFSLTDFAMPGLVTVQNGTMSGGGGIVHGANGTIQLGASLTFGAVTNYHMLASTVGSQIQAVGVSYTVTGGALNHWYAADGGKIVVGLTSVTFSGGGTIAFGTTGTSAFASAKANGQILAGSNTFTCTSGCSSSGGTTTVTGRRYSAQINGYVDTGGGNLVTQGSAPTYFPGSAVGIGSTMNLSPYGFCNC